LVDTADPDMAGDGTWYRDFDGDGYGDSDVSVRTCSWPTGYVRNDDDCDDSDATLNVDCFAIDPVRFTNCGQTGRNGPTQSQCDSAYASTELSGIVSVSSGIQKVTIPENATYTITIAGAAGMSATASYTGGRGAEIKGDFALRKGDTLSIVVGQMGSRTGTTSGSGGGGGGSFVWSGSSTLLIAAGGGGGTRNAAAKNGCDGQTGTAATNSSVSSSSGGCGTKSTGIGSGGIASSTSWGSGGAGWGGAGGSDTSYGNGGSGLSGNFVGGATGSSCTSGLGADGGFGGGGSGAGCWGGGGGGGYSGGDGGYIAGGGGSYNSGTSTSGSAGFNTGHGYVIIQKK
jgi:hypothetical protein